MQKIFSFLVLVGLLSNIFSPLHALAADELSPVTVSAETTLAISGTTTPVALDMTGVNTNTGALMSFTGAQSGTTASGVAPRIPSVDYSGYVYFSGTLQKNGVTYGNGYYPESLGLTSVDLSQTQRVSQTQRASTQSSTMVAPSSGLVQSLSAPSTGLLGQWLFDESALDSSSNGNNATAFDLTYTGAGTGYLQQVGVWNGSTTSVSVANDISLTSAATWSFWVYLNAFVGDAAIVSKRDGGTENAFQIAIEGTNPTSGRLLTYLWNAPFGNTASNPGFLELNKWMHIVVTFDGTNVSYYRDTVFDSTAVDIGNIVSTPLAMHIGDDWFGHKLNGKLHSLHIYNRVLSSTEIAELYQDGIAEIVPNTTSEPYVNTVFAANPSLTYDKKSGTDNHPAASNAKIQEVLGSAAQIQKDTTTAGDPITLATGEFTYDNTLMSLPGIGNPYELKLQYKNQADYNGPLGFNWDHSYNQYLSGETNGNVLYNNGSLGTFRFIANGTGYLRNEGLRANLILSGGLYTIAYEDGRKSEFDSANRLRYLRDRNGNTLTLDYSGGYLSGVTDTVGRTIRYNYYNHNRLASIVEPGGRRVDFVYYTGATNSGNLYDLARITLTNATGASRSIAYEYSTGATGVLMHNLIRLIDAKGQSYVENSYTNDDRVATQQYGSGVLTYTYTLSGSSITKNTVIDQLGYKSEYNYDASGNNTTTLYYNPAQTGSLTYTYEYNTGGLLTKEKRPSGYGYIATYDQSGNLLQMEKKLSVDLAGSGVITSYKYNTKNELIREINPVGKTILYTRDPSGNILTQSLTGAISFSGSQRDFITTYTYTTGGLLSKEKSPEGRVKNYSYLSGLLMTFSYGSGTETSTGSYTYTPYGLPLTHTDGDGFSESWTYTPFDQVETHTTPLGGGESFTYDANGNILTAKSLVGSGATVDTSYTYDILDRPLTQTQEVSEGTSVTTTYTYDVAGNLIAKKIGDGALLTMTYNEFARPLEERIIMTPGNPSDDIVTQYEYNTDNFVSKKYDPRGNSTRYSYNAIFSTINTISYPDGLSKVIGFKSDGFVSNSHVFSSGTYQDGQAYNYDGFGHTVYQKIYSGSSFLSGGLETRYIYDKDGNIVITIDQRGLTGSTTYNSRGLLATEKDRGNNTTTYTYDKRGNIVTKVLTPIIGSGMTMTNYYDREGNLTGTLDNSGGLRSYTYNSLRQLIRAVDEMGRITDYIRDYRGLPLTETEYLSGVAVTTTRTYDSRGNLTSIRDPKNNLTTYEYDGKNRLTKTIYPDLTFSAITYDKSDNIATTTDPNGSTFTHTYDNRDRRIATTITRGSGVLGFTGITYGYDLFGNLTRVSDSNSGIVTYAYDKYARLTSETQKLPGTGATTTVSYTYDNNGNLLTRKFPDTRSIAYTYDALDRPLAVTWSGTSIATYGYSGVLLSAVNLGNSAKVRYSYDKLYRLTTLSGVSMTLPKITLTYDKSGLITSDSRRNYVYDSLLRLTSAAPPSGSGNTLSGSIESFTYDLSGNRTTATRNLSGSTYTTNSLDEYTSTTGALLSGSILSDANGNIIADATKKYSYDAYNHLIEVRSLSGNTLIASYTYDGLGRRTQKYIPNTTSTGLTLPTLARTTSYISSGDTPIQEVITNGSGTKLNQLFIVLGKGEDEVLAYDYASGSSNTGSRYYPITDHLGSVIGIVNASRTLVERYIYDSYGKPYRVYGSGTGIGNGTFTIQSMDAGTPGSTGSLYGNTRLYTGRYYDREVGLSYHRARYYDPSIGRFMGRDPIGQRDQINLFTYVKNSPLIFVDRLGLAKALIFMGVDHLYFGRYPSGTLAQSVQIEYNKLLQKGYKRENIYGYKGGSIAELNEVIKERNYKDIAVVAHASNERIRLTYDGNINTEHINSNTVDQLPVLSDKNITLTIIGCLAGAGDNSIAEQIANRMGVTVIAPTSLLNVTNGEEFMDGGQVKPEGVSSSIQFGFNQVFSGFYGKAEFKTF